MVKWGEEIYFQKVTLRGLSCSILGELYDFTDPELYSIICKTSIVGKALPGKHVLPVLRCLEMHPEDSTFLKKESIWNIEENNLVLTIPLRDIRFVKYIGVREFNRALFGYEVMGSESITGEECFEFMESIHDTIFTDVINTWKVLWYLGVKIPTKNLITKCENLECENKTTGKDVKESIELWLNEPENIEREPILLCRECLKKVKEGELDISEIL
ncbi:MAG: hypothetical protein ACTSYM_14080 [Candidatus Baldrarchaeia archaeon]